VTRTELEARRLAAVPDLQSSISLQVIAKRYEVSRMTASRWRHTVQNGRSLAATKSPGRPRRLTADQESVLKRLWLLGPMVLLDADTERWTHTRFADAVGRHVGVRYSGDHMGRIMLRLGLTVRRQWIRKSERWAGGLPVT
jgi:putative transposase